MVKCEECDGKGKHWYRYDIEKDRDEECTEDEWLALPTEEEAEISGSPYARGEVEQCELCDGLGEIEYEEDYEPDYDD